MDSDSSEGVGYTDSDPELSSDDEGFVRTPAGPGKQPEQKPKQKELIGKWVKVDGLSMRNDLNGRCGKVLEYNETKGRYAVRLDDPRGVGPFNPILVSRINLLQIEAQVAKSAREAAAAAAASASAAAEVPARLPPLPDEGIAPETEADEHLVLAVQMIRMNRPKITAHQLLAEIQSMGWPEIALSAVIDAMQRPELEG